VASKIDDPPEIKLCGMVCHCFWIVRLRICTSESYFFIFQGNVEENGLIGRKTKKGPAEKRIFFLEIGRLVTYLNFS
jgi:hypothetical protein